MGEHLTNEPMLAAFRKLMDMGAIESRLKDFPVGIGDAMGKSETTLNVFATYNLSPFCKALAQRAMLQMTGGQSSQQLREMMDKLIGPGRK